MKSIRTITASELMEALKGVPPEAQIAFSSDYGDHCHTEQIHSIEGNIEEKEHYESSYSDSGFAVLDEGDSWEDEKGKIFIIS